MHCPLKVRDAGGAVVVVNERGKAAYTAKDGSGFVKWRRGNARSRR